MHRLHHVVIFLVTTVTLIYRGHCTQTFRIQPDDTTGILGQTILLRCEIDDLDGKVTWTRDGFGLGLDRGLQGFPRYRMEGAEPLGEFTLMISNLQLEDDAEFQCQVMSSRGGMASRKAKVTVYLPPSTPVIESGAATVEVVVGTDYNMTCTAKNGRPAARLSWSTGTMPLTEGTYYSTTAQPDSKLHDATSLLTITPRKSDQGSKYYCEAENEGTAGRVLTNSIALEVHYPPEVTMLVTPRHDRIKEGTSVTFSCDASGNPNVMTWRWFREEEELVGQTDRVLVHRVDRDWHGAKVACEAKNKVGSKRQSVVLNVEYAPRFTAGAEHVAADVGDDAVLTCNVDGNPPPTIIWNKSGSDTILSSRKELKLYGVTEISFGVYVCKASILGFNEIEMRVHLLKKGPPRLVSPVEQSARFGETGLIECLSVSVPKPTSVIWHKDGVEMDFEKLERYSTRSEDLPDGKRNIIEIVSVQDEDYGQYNCTVENGYGQDVMGITFAQREVVPLEYIVAGVLVGVFVIIVIAVVLVVYRKRKSSSSESSSDVSGDSLDHKESGIPYKVEYSAAPGGNPYILDAWKPEADRNLYRNSAEYDELNYAPKQDPWAADPYNDHRENIYGSHYGGVGPGYARSDYGTYPGLARNNIYEPSGHGSQNIYGGPAFSDYGGVYGTYGRNRANHYPPAPRSDFNAPAHRPDFNPAIPRSDFIPASELGRPSTSMSNRLATNV